MDLHASSVCFTVMTQRLRIRPLSGEDEDIYCFLYTDEETMRFVGKPLSLEGAQRSFRKAVELSSRRPLAQLFMTVIHQDSGEPAGVCSLQKVDVGREAVEVGIMLKPAARDRSIAKEALTALIDVVFGSLGALEVWADIPRAHAAAVGVLTRLGFSPPPQEADSPGSPCRSIWSINAPSWRRSTIARSTGPLAR
jgi:RimJ/RimL family protein N-acetyltransferase